MGLTVITAAGTVIAIPLAVEAEGGAAIAAYVAQHEATPDPVPTPPAPTPEA